PMRSLDPLQRLFESARSLSLALQPFFCSRSIGPEGRVGMLRRFQWNVCSIAVSLQLSTVSAVFLKCLLRPLPAIRRYSTVSSYIVVPRADDCSSYPPIRYL